jgi:hypothetical protein
LFYSLLVLCGYDVIQSPGLRFTTVQTHSRSHHSLWDSGSGVCNSKASHLITSTQELAGPTHTTVIVTQSANLHSCIVNSSNGCSPSLPQIRPAQGQTQQPQMLLPS